MENNSGNTRHFSDQDSEEGVLLEQAIERVLGIPIVDYAKSDVTDIGRTG